MDQISPHLLSCLCSFDPFQDFFNFKAVSIVEECKKCQKEIAWREDLGGDVVSSFGICSSCEREEEGNDYLVVLFPIKERPSFT